jgi:glutamate dehydrogenase
MNTTLEEHLQSALEEEKALFEKFYLWLEKSFSPLLFTDLPTDWITLIVHALMGFKVQGFFSEIHIKNAAIALCLDAPEADVRILKNYSMYGIKNYTTYVSQQPLPLPEMAHPLRIAIIRFTSADKEQEIASGSQDLINCLRRSHPEWSEESCNQMIKAQDPSFLRKLSTERQAIAIEMFARAETRDHCQYHVQYAEGWRQKENAAMQLTLAWKNTPKHNFLYRLARMIHRHHLVMHDVNATYLYPYTTNSILMLSLDIRDAKETNKKADIEDFLQELVTLKYFAFLDPIEFTFVKPGLIRGNLGNFLRSAINFIHQVLVNVDPYEYSLEQIIEGLCHHPDLTVMVCNAFEYKFHPEKHDLIQFEKVRDQFTNLVLHLDTGHEAQDISRRNILLQAMNFVSHTLKCNFYRNNKTSLSFRLDPAYLDHAPFEREKVFEELPFAIFFIKGMHFIGFHIRFKDLARGGLRTIYTTKKEKMIAERNTVFIECYNLALTQHKKNKDIPEGGAKGVIFLKPYEHLESEADILRRELKEAKIAKEEIERRITQFKEEQKLEYLYQTQRSFIDSLLSLINCNEDGSLKTKHIVDYYRLPEYIYLGPDENMHDVMIEWIAARSIKVGYRPGGAFISGKPSCGINHKKYGVTSCGVNVFMHEILCYLKKDPYTDPFTVKITGGPDGDVAGNQIYNLYRYYPKTAKVLALTDVSGTIYDPEGLMI